MELDGPASDVELDGPANDVELDGPASDVELYGPASDVELYGPASDVELDEPASDVELDGPALHILAGALGNSALYHSLSLHKISKLTDVLTCEVYVSAPKIPLDPPSRARCAAIVSSCREF